MKFTYKEYEGLIEKLREESYCFCSYSDWEDKESCVILRHDVDYDLNKSLKLAQLESELGVKSTYFVLLTTDFYNVFSRESYECIQKIIEYGHEIGLHFDEVRYPEAKGNEEIISELIQKEASILGQVVDSKINVVSMHRPSKGLLESNIVIPGMINSYSQTFFKDFKYLSDSRRRWREPVDEIIESKKYSRIHLLTHAFWYNDREIDLHDSVEWFINDGNRCRFNWLLDNITDLESIMNREEIR